jgi:hypothetical protein
LTAGLNTGPRRRRSAQLHAGTGTVAVRCAQRRGASSAMTESGHRGQPRDWRGRLQMIDASNGSPDDDIEASNRPAYRRRDAGDVSTSTVIVHRQRCLALHAARHRDCRAAEPRSNRVPAYPGIGGTGEAGPGRGDTMTARSAAVTFVSRADSGTNVSGRSPMTHETGDR